MISLNYHRALHYSESRELLKDNLYNSIKRLEKKYLIILSGNMKRIIFLILSFSLFSFTQAEVTKTVNIQTPGTLGTVNLTVLEKASITN